MLGNFNPQTNFPTGRKQKGLVKLMYGLTSIFYYTSVPVQEGVAMVVSEDVTITQEHAPQLMRPAQPGEGASVIGLALQATYEDSAAALGAQFGQLAGFYFANDTAQRLDGMPIGVLVGTGWAFLRNYSGDIVPGNQAYVGTSGVLKASGSAGDEVPVVFETAATGGVANAIQTNKTVRIRYSFPLAPVVVAS